MRWQSGVVGCSEVTIPRGREVTKYDSSRTVLERRTIAGDSPVGERIHIFLSVSPSTAEHVEFRGNLGGPSPKAKYKPMTDSELVP